MSIYEPTEVEIIDFYALNISTDEFDYYSKDNDTGTGEGDQQNPDNPYNPFAGY